MFTACGLLYCASGNFSDKIFNTIFLSRKNNLKGYNFSDQIKNAQIHLTWYMVIKISPYTMGNINSHTDYPGNFMIITPSTHFKIVLTTYFIFHL